MYLDVLTHEQFIAIFQGLCLCGTVVFHQDHLNKVLNSFVQRLEGQVNDEQMTFEEVVQTFELVLNYGKMLRNSSTEATVHELDLEELMRLANEKFFAGHVAQDEQVSVYRLACLYWVYSEALKDNATWDVEIVKHLERHLNQAIRAEIKLQKRLEIERDDRTDSGLQSMRLSDLRTIKSVYERAEGLK